MKIRLQKVDSREVYCTVELSSKGVLTLRDFAQRIVRESQVCEPFDSCSTVTDITNYALKGVESLQSAIRGVAQQTVLESSVLQYCLHTVSGVDAYTGRYPYLQRTYLLRNWLVELLLGNKYWFVYDRATLSYIATEEDFWVDIIQMKTQIHPDDKGFTAYCTVGVGDSLEEVVS